VVSPASPSCRRPRAASGSSWPPSRRAFAAARASCACTLPVPPFPSPRAVSVHAPARLRLSRPMPTWQRMRCAPGTDLLALLHRNAQQPRLNVPPRLVNARPRLPDPSPPSHPPSPSRLLHPSLAVSPCSALHPYVAREARALSEAVDEQQQHAKLGVAIRTRGHWLCWQLHCQRQQPRRLILGPADSPTTGEH
jgi:hypothetical protein